MHDTSNIQMIPVDSIIPYHEDLFSPYDDAKLQELSDSIRLNGVLTPVIVLRLQDNKYEMLSGHNRLKAAKLAGLKEISSYIKENLSEEDAKAYVIECNAYQRSFSEMSISEQAMVMAYEYNARKCQGKRNDIMEEIKVLQGNESISDGQKVQKSKTSRDEVGALHNMSGKTVERFIRLTALSAGLKKKLDDGIIQKSVGVELSYLKDDEQEAVDSYLDQHEGEKLQFNLAKVLHKASETFTFPLVGVDVFIKDQKDKLTESKDKKSKKSIVIDEDIYNLYFKDLSKEEIQEQIISSLKAAKSQRKKSSPVKETNHDK